MQQATSASTGTCAATQSSPRTYLERDGEHTTKSKHNLEVYTDLHREE